MLIFKGIMIVILSFSLGVTFTLFCMRINKRGKDKDGNDT